MAKEKEKAGKVKTTLSPQEELAQLEQAVQTAVDKAEADRVGGDDKKGQDFSDRVREVSRTSAHANARKITHAFGSVTKEMLSTLRSPDPEARRMAMLFFLGLAGVLAVGTLAYRRYVHTQDLSKLKSTGVEETSKNIGAFIQKQAESAKKKVATITVGKFTVDLRPIDGSKPARGVLNVAEVEITLECDDKDTRYYIEDNLPRVRDQFTRILSNLDRDDLLTREGKKKLKKRLIDQLNMWLPKGRVEDLFVFNQILS